MMPPTSIDGTDITGATIDGTDVQEITVDGQTVFSALPSTVVTRNPDDDSSTQTDKFGMVVETSQQWNDIGATLSGNVAGVNRAYIHEFPSGTLVGDIDITSVNAGESFTFGLSLSANEKYSFVVDAQGSSYTNGRDDNASYPITSPDGNMKFIGCIESGNGLTALGNSTHANSILQVGDVGF